jgi:hypothetical protein
MMNNQLNTTVLLVALLAVAGANCAVAQQPPAKSAADKKAPANATPEKKAPGQALMEKKQYDAYDPSKRLRNSMQACMRDEDYAGAYCAKKCKAGYQMEVRGNFATCRSLTPLPPGVFPGPRSKESGTQQKLPPQPYRPPLKNAG